MSNLFKDFSSGDTIIEVLIAVTVFSMIAVGGISIMNQGAATAQRSLEITLVRQEIDAQAEALRFLNANFVSEYVNGKDDYGTLSDTWTTLSELAKNTIKLTPFGVANGKKCSDIIPVNTGFVINTRNLKYQPIKGISSSESLATYSKINYDVQNIDSIDGLWIEAVKGEESPAASTGYIDFHIRACWESIGQSFPMTIGTIVRLYEPRS